jgi:hypothetical protein
MIIVKLDHKLHTLFDKPGQGYNLVHIQCVNNKTINVWTSADSLNHPDIVKYVEHLGQQGHTPTRAWLYTYTQKATLPQRPHPISF